MTGKVPILVNRHSIALCAQHFSCSVKTKHYVNNVNDFYVLDLISIVDNVEYVIYSFIVDTKLPKMDVADYAGMNDLLTLLSASITADVLGEFDGKAPINILESASKNLQKIISNEDKETYSSCNHTAMALERLMILNEYKKIEDFLNENPTMSLQEFITGK